MNNHHHASPIETTFDAEVDSFIVRMPENITLNALKVWHDKFMTLLRERVENGKVSILLDTNKHKFESIECLKLLRKLLNDEPLIKTSISKIAFVAPKQYREPEVVSTEEAYFLHFEDALNWLRKIG